MLKKTKVSDNNSAHPSLKVSNSPLKRVTSNLLFVSMPKQAFQLSMRPFTLTFLFLLIVSIGCKPENGEKSGEHQKQIPQQVRVWVDSCWNQRDFEALRNLTYPQSTRYMNGVKVAEGATEIEAHLQLFFTAFPDLVITTEEIHYKDSLAFLQWNARGTNTGIFGEVRPTGKRININGLSHLKFSAEGKIIRESVYYNELELLQQLGYTLIPPNLE